MNQKYKKYIRVPLLFLVIIYYFTVILKSLDFG